MRLSRQLFAILSLFFLGLLLPSVAFAADICEGYDSNDKTHTVQSGICYYALRPDESPNYSTTEGDCGLVVSCTPVGKNPTCSQMTANDYHKDPNYHGITDEIQHCAFSFGGTYACCAKNDQSKIQPVAPPPPCVLDSNGKCNQVSTAFGNVNVDAGTIVGSIFSILLSLSGGIAIVIIIISGYKIMFSQADPERLKGAREAITSALIGLLFIIFSVAILRIIGVNILHIPGLNQ